MELGPVMADPRRDNLVGKQDHKQALPTQRLSGVEGDQVQYHARHEQGGFPAGGRRRVLGLEAVHCIWPAVVKGDSREVRILIESAWLWRALLPEIAKITTSVGLDEAGFPPLCRGLHLVTSFETRVQSRRANVSRRQRFPASQAYDRYAFAKLTRQRACQLCATGASLDSRADDSNRLGPADDDDPRNDLPSRPTYRRPPMPDFERKSSLLEELEQRQDEVIAQLDQLNARIENLLNECLQTRKPELQVADL